MLGKPVPDLSLPATGHPFQLSDFKGHPVVLYFYPKDSTPGCTTEAQQFAELYPKFKRAGVEVFGISRDSVKSHDNFKAKLNLPFELVSDPEEVACNAFGVMKIKNMYGRQVRGVERSTFVIDAKGVLRQEWRGVKVPGHAQEVLDFVKAL
jgi:thioredoxin-dependent peroxiredoxin